MTSTLRQRLTTLTAPLPLPLTDHRKQAAVLIAVFEDEPGYPVLFTRRAERLRRHGGEICLPGGLMEPGDGGSPVVTALRETEEELGLTAERVNVRAVLPPHDNSDGLRVHPVLAAARRPGTWRPQSREVSGILEVPLRVFDKAGHYRREVRRYRGIDKETLVLHYRDESIWGLTARIMDGLRQHLNTP
ncbi:MAG: CoA pyrophosphatase [Alcanivorax sp.]|nr:CoA pyrophosphatase [Alcanivorax sp.]